jgi:hypothetical protein
MTFFDRIRGYLRSTISPAPQDPPSGGDPENNWKQMQELLQQIEDARNQVLDKEGKGNQDQRRAAILSQEQERAQELQQQMLEDILELHGRLKTDLNETELRRLAQSLRDHYDHFRPHHDHRMTHIVMFAVLKRMHLEARRHGWDELLEVMAKADVSWPKPTGLSPTCDAEELIHARSLQLEREARDFLAGTMLQFADLVVGVVPIWRAAYPERGSSVWASTALTGVGAALALRYHERIVAATEQLHDELEADVASQLNEQLKGIQAKLADGVDSIGQAIVLTDEAVLICQHTAPELIWQKVQTLLSKATSSL